MLLCKKQRERFQQDNDLRPQTEFQKGSHAEPAETEDSRSIPEQQAFIASTGTRLGHAHNIHEQQCAQIVRHHKWNH